MTLFVSYWCHQFTIMRLSPGATGIPHIWWGLILAGHPKCIYCELGVHSHVFLELIKELHQLIGPWQVKVHLTWGTTRHFLVHICHWNDNQTCGRVIPAIKWDHITVSNILHIDKCNLKGYNLQFFLFLTHALYLLFLSFLHQICPSTYCRWSNPTRDSPQFQILAILQGCTWRLGWQPRPQFTSCNSTSFLSKPQRRCLSKLPIFMFVQSAIHFCLYWMGGVGNRCAGVWECSYRWVGYTPG